MKQNTKFDRNALNAAAERNYALYKMLNDLDDRRERIERCEATYAEGSPLVGYSPGFLLDEVDDGTVGPVASTGFVPVNEIRNTYRKESWTEAQLPVEPVLAEGTQPDLPVVEVRSHVDLGRSPVNYAARYKSKLPELRNVIVLMPRAKRHTPYKPGMLKVR